MRSDWKKYTIGEIAQVFDGPHATPSKTDNGPIFLGISNLVNGRIDLSNIEYLSDEDFVTWTRRVIPTNGDIVFSYETRLGEVAIIPPNLKCCLGRRMGLLRINRELVEPRFLLYYYLGPEFQNIIQERKIHGSTVERISIKEMPDFPVYLPPLPTQRRIAAILTALDDKIELNRRMNETLEGIAQAIWAEWFGKYANGEEELPEGWRWGKIEDIALVKGGGTPSTRDPEFWDGDIAWTSPKDLSNSPVPLLFETEKKITKKGLNQISSGLLPKNTLLLSSRAPIGYIALTQIPVAINQGYIAINCRNGISNLYMLFWLKNNLDKVIERANGSTFLEISKSNFKEINILLPNLETHNKFIEIITYFFNKIIENEKQSKTLSILRNDLLQKLINGEIDL